MEQSMEAASFFGTSNFKTFDLLMFREAEFQIRKLRLERLRRVIIVSFVNLIILTAN